MKKILCFVLSFFTVLLIGCGCNGCNAIELMGAGDRIHDTFTFANVGVKINKIDDSTFEISGTVDKIENSAVKQEFSIDDEVNYVVAIKLTAIECEVDKNNINITVNGNRSYDAEHLNGSDYTFIILEAKPNSNVVINVKWNQNIEMKTYTVKFSNDLILK